MINLHERMLPTSAGIEPTTPSSPVWRASNWATEAGSQGSVLGPILFVLFVNDLPDNVQSQARLFADDTAVYPNINDPDDSVASGKTLTYYGSGRRSGTWNLTLISVRF